LGWLHVLYKEKNLLEIIETNQKARTEHKARSVVGV